MASGLESGRCNISIGGVEGLAWLVGLGSRCILAGCSSFLFIVAACAINMRILQLFTWGPGVSLCLWVVVVRDVKFTVCSVTHVDAGFLEPIAYFTSTGVELRFGGVSTCANRLNVLVRASCATRYATCSSHLYLQGIHVTGEAWESLCSRCDPRRRVLLGRRATTHLRPFAMIRL